MKKLKVTAWACAAVGRFEIYKTYEDALRNAISKEYVIEVLITNIQAGDRD